MLNAEVMSFACGGTDAIAGELATTKSAIATVKVRVRIILFAFSQPQT